MTKVQVRKLITNYLKNHNIHHHYLNDSDKPLIDIQDLTVHIEFCVEEAPNHITECAIWFYEDCMEVRGYYCENVAGWLIKHRNNIPDVLQVINFLNARVFLGNLLYTPRFYITTEEIPEFAIITIIPYQFLELSELESMEYITCYYPEFLGKVSFPLFGTLFGDISPEKAMYYIRKELLNEEDAE